MHRKHFIRWEFSTCGTKTISLLIFTLWTIFIITFPALLNTQCVHTSALHILTNICTLTHLYNLKITFVYMIDNFHARSCKYLQTYAVVMIKKWHSRGLNLPLWILVGQLIQVYIVDIRARRRNYWGCCHNVYLQLFPRWSGTTWYPCLRQTLSSRVSWRGGWSYCICRDKQFSLSKYRWYFRGVHRWSQTSYRYTSCTLPLIYVI